MGCKKGCGNGTSNIELIVKDLIRGMIDDGRIQEGLVDCTDKRIFRNTRVITCDLLKDALCHLLDSGDVCITMPEALAIDDEGHVVLTLTNGEQISTKSTLPDTKLEQVVLEGTRLKFTLSNGKVLPNVDLADVLAQAGMSVTKDAAGNVTLTKPGQDPVVIPAPVPAPVFGNSLTTRDGKIEVNEDILPKFGTTIQAVNGKLEVAHDDTLFVKPDGRLSVRNKDCVEVNNLDALEGTPLGKWGMTCFYKAIETRAGQEALVIGMPTNPISTEPTQSALRSVADLANEFRTFDAGKSFTADLTGWQVASGTEIAQTVIVNGHAWSRSNRGGMTESGRLGDSGAWSPWRKLDAVPTPPPPPTNRRDIVFKNSSGKEVLGYGYSTEQ